MPSNFVIADMIGPGTLIVIGGAGLLIIGGICLSLAVLVVSLVRRKKTRPPRANEDEIVFPNE